MRCSAAASRPRSRAAQPARQGPGAAAAAGVAVGPAGSVPALLQQAQEHYDRALAAQRAGDWAEYGRQIDALGAAIRQLQSRQRLASDLKLPQ